MSQSADVPMDAAQHRPDVEGVSVINVHTHCVVIGGDDDPVFKEEFANRVGAMDALNVRKSIILCIWPSEEESAFHYQYAAPNRFTVFVGIDFSRVGRRDFTERAVQHVEEAMKAGARGLKFELGKPDYHVMPLDDPRMDPIYAKAGELGIPIMYHSSDPEEFFHPPNRFNFWRAHRLAEVEFAHNTCVTPAPSREQLHRERENMLRKHPGGYSVRTERWRYTTWYNGRKGEELYDYEKDPAQLHNQIKNPEFADIAAALRAMVQKNWAKPYRPQPNSASKDNKAGSEE